jgi:aspartate racemase
MEETFYQERLKRYGIDTLVPGEEDRKYIGNVIYEELSREIFKEASRKRFVEIIESLADRGAEGIILGCTEIPLLVSEKDTEVPLFNTLDIHARAGARFLCEK